jgi:hypothetical protein
MMIYQRKPIVKHCNPVNVVHAKRICEFLHELYFLNCETKVNYYNNNNVLWYAMFLHACMQLDVTYVHVMYTFIFIMYSDVP